MYLLKKRIYIKCRKINLSKKNFEFLIENFSEIQNEIKKKLIIIGSGENKKKLQKLFY